MTSIDEGARRAVEADIASVAGLAARATAELSELRGGRVWSQLEARADPQLESLSPAQKLLLRLGPENGDRVRSKVRELYGALE